MKEIFISYRRQDSSDVTGRIFDHLKKRYGEKALFKDVDSIPAGEDFREVIDKAVGQCKVLLAIIGDDWLEIKDAQNRRRLDLADDFVRAEIATALKREIPVIPILVEGQTMPGESDLPEELKALAYRNAKQIRTDPDFQTDVNRLYKELDPLVRPKRSFYSLQLVFGLAVLFLIGLFIRTTWMDCPKLEGEQLRKYQLFVTTARTYEENGYLELSLKNYQAALDLRPCDPHLKEIIKLKSSKTN